MSERTFEVEGTCTVTVDIPDGMSDGEAKEMAEYAAFAHGFDNWDVIVTEMTDDETSEG
jgi:hypothetical protein